MAEYIGEGFDGPEDSWGGPRFRWLHVRGRDAVRVVVLSERPVWYVGHWSEGRMRLCERFHCGLCAAGVGRQVRFVFAVATMETRSVCLLEVGRIAGELIRDWVHRRGRLRGMVLCLSRHSDSKRSALVCEYVDIPEPDWIDDLRTPDVIECLELSFECGRQE